MEGGIQALKGVAWRGGIQALKGVAQNETLKWEETMLLKLNYYNMINIHLLDSLQLIVSVSSPIWQLSFPLWPSGSTCSKVKTRQTFTSQGV